MIVMAFNGKYKYLSNFDVFFNGLMFSGLLDYDCTQVKIDSTNYL
jgi:hypothetical protein